jgi:hypothetical protein
MHNATAEGEPVFARDHPTGNPQLIRLLSSSLARLSETWMALAELQDMAERTRQAIRETRELLARAESS